MRKQRLNVIEGFKAFQRFLQSERSRFSAAPIILLESQAQTKHGKPDKQVDETCRRTTFLLQQQMQFRTFVSHPLIEFAFPTESDLEHAIELAARIGASTVAAVGAGGVMDLAKAVFQSSARHDIEEILLVPATYGATLAAASSSSLLLDPQHATLTVFPQEIPLEKRPKTVALISSNEPTNRRTEAIYACLSLILDEALRACTTEECENEKFKSQIVKLSRLLKAQGDDFGLMELTKLLIQVGEDLSFGMEGDSCSIPLALAAALIPKDFPQYDILTFMASISKAIYEEFDHHNLHIEALQSEHFALAPKVFSTQSIDALASSIKENQTFWRCSDRSDRVRRILQELTLH